MYALIRKCVFILLFITTIISCDNYNSADYPSLPGYDLNHPRKYNLREELDEISGIVYYPKDTTILAINDENGILYKIFPKKNVHVLKWKFSRGADFEDLALVDSVFYVLISNGDIVSFQVISQDSVLTKKYFAPYHGKNEFESLYYDSAIQKLILICKDCAADKKKEISAVSFSPGDSAYSDSPVFTLDGKRINEMLKTTKEKIKPSAAALNPITGELYVLSAVNKAMIVCEKSGEVKAAIPLNPAIFKQPEGIAFTPNGDLIISNEAADAGASNILIFNYKVK